jgi:hypothetical protein
MRKNLMIVEEYKKAGIDFVPVPVLNDADKLILVKLADKQLTKIEEECEG